MSTRSIICIEKEDGSMFGIYCQNNGCPKHNGKMLVTNYQSREKVLSLLELGDISHLKERVSPNEGEFHSFDSPAEGVTIAYRRDKGETHSALSASLITLETAKECDAEYVYVFGLDDKWRYIDFQDEDEHISPIPIEECDNYYEPTSSEEATIDFDSMIIGV